MCSNGGEMFAQGWVFGQEVGVAQGTIEKTKTEVNWHDGAEEVSEALVSTH